MTETFTWRTTTESSGEGSFDVSQSKFGDGYRQPVPKGLNNEAQEWSVVIVGSAAELAEPLAFIRRHQGATAFYWKPPLGVLNTYDCAKYSCRPIAGNFYTLSMMFVEAFRP